MTVKRRHTMCLLALLVMGAVAACKKVIQVDLKDASSRVVIEGEIINVAGSFQVRVSRSVPYSNDNNFPPVSGATIMILDSTSGYTYGFGELSPGLYTSAQFGALSNHMYKLSVNADGQLYTAISTMPGMVHLDSVTFAVNTDFNGKKEINAVVNFQDPPGLGNYYQFVEYVNGRKIPNIFVFEDRLSDGRYIEQPLFNDSTYLQKNDTVTVKMFCVDKPVYDYFFSLSLIANNNNGGFQSASPANPTTNFTGGALGYFSAHTITQEKLLVY